MMTSNKNVSFLRQQLKGAHEFLEGVMADVKAEHAHWKPGGKANPIGATYAHVVTSEDAIINGTLKEAPPLFASTWAGKVGISQPPPAPSPDSPGLPDWRDWAVQIQVDLSALRQYAQAVYAATDDYLASLSDDDLTDTLDLSALGLGERTVADVLLGGVLSNVQWHTGEISCLKGLQGLKGYPV